jgi:hypothetical protein
VRIDWNGGSGSGFDVYRNWRLGDAFLPIARSIAAGPVFDENVGVGETLNYFVAALSPSPCSMISPGSMGTNIVTVTIARPEVRMGSILIEEAAGGGDGDGVVEPGETATVQVTLAETGGTSGASDLSAVLSSLLPGVVAANGPVPFGSLTPGGTASGAVPFTVGVSPDTPCGSSLFSTLSISSNDGCWLDGIGIPIGDGSCDVFPGGFIRPVAGSLAGVSDSGDGDGIADNCEISTFSYQLANVGGSFSGPMTAQVVSLTPEARVVGGGRFVSPGLRPDETVTPFFSIDLTAAGSSTPLEFSISADSLANPGPAIVEFLTTGEEESPVFGNVMFDFETGDQGWQIDGFSLSSARASSGALSLHAGSTAQPWLCQRALSPIVRLDPAGSPFLDLQAYLDIEPPGITFGDRSNVHVIEIAAGVHSLIEPTAGISYNATGNSLSQICHIDQEDGWTGNQAPFGGAQFDLQPWAGEEIRIEITYATDGGGNSEGIYIDDVILTGATLLPGDMQSDACDYAPEVSGPQSSRLLEVSSASPGMEFRWEDLGAGFTYNLYAGELGAYFSHALEPLICDSSGIVCDGMECLFSVPSVEPSDLYFLVTATRDGRQGPSGFTSSGLQRDPSQDSCSP